MPNATTVHGFCDATQLDDHSDCEQDDKGAFPWPWRSASWEEALAFCRESCLRCARCNAVSVSLQWRDCSWFNECDLARLRDDIPGFRTEIVRHSTFQAAAYAQRLHGDLWAELRRLPRVSSDACRTQLTSCGEAWPTPHHSHVALSFTALHEKWAAPAACKGNYYHAWPAAEHFFHCVVLPHIQAGSGDEPPAWRTVFLPSVCPGHNRLSSVASPIFSEIATLFSGAASRLRIERRAEVPMCRASWELQPQQCCVNVSDRTALRHALQPKLPQPGALDLEHPRAQHLGHVAKPSRVAYAEVRVNATYAPVQLRAAMRRVAWANLDADDGSTADTVLFASAEGGSNGRRIADEATVAEAVRRTVARVAPHLRFRHQRLQMLSFSNEVRLLRRTRVLIALFGAGISGCRMLPPGAVVLQIDGALKGETSRFALVEQYREVCEDARLGVRWAAFVVPGWRQRYPRDALAPDFKTARVPPAPFAEFVERALKVDPLENDTAYQALRREHLAVHNGVPRTLLPTHEWMHRHGMKAFRAIGVSD